METSLFQSIKLSVISAAGLSKDSLHIYVGLAVFLFVALVVIKSVKSAAPLLAVFFVAIIGEILDMRDDFSSLGYWRWQASMHDVVNTLFWPTVLFFLAKCGLLAAKKDNVS